jgi:hypothetical protein
MLIWLSFHTIEFLDMIVVTLAIFSTVRVGNLLLGTRPAEFFTFAVFKFTWILEIKFCRVFYYDADGILISSADIF